MVTRVKNVLGKNSIIKVLLSLVIVLAMISQFALPAMADMVVGQLAPGFMPTTISTTSVTTSSSYTTLYSYTVPTNTTATSVNIECACANYEYYLKVVANGTTVIGPVVVNESTTTPTYVTSGNFSAGAGTTILIEAEEYSSGQSIIPVIYGTTGSTSPFSYTYSSTLYWVTPTYLILEYDAANETTATNAYNEATSAYNEATSAYNEAVTAASNASTAASNASTAATNASTAATNASNAYTAANTASTNTANDPTADTAITNATNGMAKTFTAANTASTNTTNDPTADTAITNGTNGIAATFTQASSADSNALNASTNTANDPTADTAITNATTGIAATNTQATNAANNTTYSGQSAAYWANQAATAATSNIIPVISSVVGQNGATCTTGTTFTANVAISPSSSITYTVTGVPGYSASGNSITFTGLSSGAYTAIITATYTPTGKTCTYPFTFFKI
jgi:hypothetical protein